MGVKEKRGRCGGEEGQVWRRGAGVEKRGGCGEGIKLNNQRMLVW